MKIKEGKIYKFVYYKDIYLILLIRKSIKVDNKIRYTCKILHDGDMSATKLNSGSIITIETRWKNGIKYIHFYKKTKDTGSMFEVKVKSEKCISESDAFFYLL